MPAGFEHNKPDITGLRPAANKLSIVRPFPRQKFTLRIEGVLTFCVDAGERDTLYIIQRTLCT